LEAELKRRLSSLEVELAQIKTELKAKDEAMKLALPMSLHGLFRPEFVGTTPTIQSGLNSDDDEEDLGGVKDHLQSIGQ
jgi:hypothetical protein